jgi:hypothetical protein
VTFNGICKHSYIPQRGLYLCIYPRLCFKLHFLDPTFVKERCVVRPVHLLFRYISSVWTLGLTHISPFSTHFPTMSSTAVRAAVPNGIPRPDLDLPVGHCSRFLVNIRILRCPSFQYPDRPEVITDNLLKLTELAPDPCVHLIYISLRPCSLKRSGEGRRARFVFKNLISKLHEFISETKCVLLPIVLSGWP